MLKFDIFVWPECHVAWTAEGISHGEGIEITTEQFVSLVDKFDLMIRSHNNIKTMHILPLGRGFSYR